MKIIALEAENVKRIKAVSIKPDGSVVEITGRNGQGKTSVLDSIWWALSDAKHIQDVPIRDGAERAVIKLDLGKLKVTRTIRRAKGDAGGFTQSLKVENEEGASYKSPQGMLDALVGELSFDPLAFARMKPEAQFDALRRFVPGFDFEQHDGLQRSDYQSRTDQNRQAKELRAQAEGVKLDEGAKGLLRVDEAGLVAELTRAGEHNADIERRRGNRERAQAEIAAKDAEAKACTERAATLRRQADEEDARAAALAEEALTIAEKIKAAGELPEPIDTTLLNTQIAAARESNRRIEAAEQAAARKAELTQRAKECEDKSEALTQAMARRDETKQKAIAAAKMPVEGISFGDGCVMLDGFPFEQASDAQQLAASVAIAAAMNPKLRVIRVRDGARLDSAAMKLLGQFAEQHDMQVWIETVESGRTGAVVIEDGMVQGAEPPAEKPEAA